MKAVLLDLSNEVWDRLRTRVAALTDDEYFWEPAPGCWTVRQRADGTWMADQPLPRPDPEPFTTIAWRLWHLIDLYGEDRAPKWLDVPPQGAPIGLDDPNGSPPASANAAIDLLELAHTRWDAHLAIVSDAALGEIVGPVAGPQYSGRTRAAYVMHMLDEFIHHGAEIAVLRDLWRWRHSIHADARVEQVMRGDAAAVANLDATGLTSDLLDVAAAYGRWAIVLDLVHRGVPVGNTGRTALHLAAGAGELEVIRTLLAHGADSAARDPEFHATPQEWATFLNHPDAVALLNERRDG